jgi:hypothetical protein
MISYKSFHLKHISSIEQKILEGHDVSWVELFSVPLMSLDYKEFHMVVEKGIAKELFYGKLNVPLSSLNDDVERLKMRILTTIANSTLEHFNKLTGDLGITNYSFVELTRSSVSDLRTGTYIYAFSDSDDLILLKVPYNLYNCSYYGKTPKSASTQNEYYEQYKDYTFVVFDKQQLVKELRIFPKKMMKDFQYFGAQLMQTDVRMNTSAPGLGTVLAEFALGSSFAMMKGISKFDSHFL